MHRLRAIYGAFRGTGWRRVSSRSDVRYRALVRLTAEDGAVSYEEPGNEQAASAMLRRYPGAVAHVVVVEERGYSDCAPRGIRIWRTVAQEPVAQGDWHMGTTPGSECIRELLSARQAVAHLGRGPVGHRVFIDKTADGYVVIGAVERVVQALGGYFFVCDNRVQQRRFDPTDPDAARETAECLTDMLHSVEQLNEQHEQQADADLESIIDGEVRAENEQERKRRADELETVLIQIARGFGP